MRWKGKMRPSVLHTRETSLLGPFTRTGRTTIKLYSTNLTGGGVQKFGAPITGFWEKSTLLHHWESGEFGPRDVFAGAQNSNTIVRVANDGTSQEYL